VDLTPVWYQEVDLVGLYAHGPELFRGERTNTFRVVIDLLTEGQLTTEGLVTHTFPLSRWKEAVATAQDKRTGAIKVAFRFD
jgi:threonine dehydrogenase-like Zn-dependent dehydrogenase